MHRAKLVKLPRPQWVKQGGWGRLSGHVIIPRSYGTLRYASSLSLSRDKLYHGMANDVGTPTWQALWTRLLTTNIVADKLLDDIAKLPRQKLADLCEEVYTTCDCHKLLLWLHLHPQTVTQGHDISQRVLPKLLSLRHYAGAREVLETALLRSDLTMHDAVMVNHTLASVFLREYSRNLSVAFGNGVVHLLLDIVSDNARDIPCDRDTFAILLAQPHFHDVTTIKACSELYMKALQTQTEDGKTWAVSPDPQIMHNIMRAYALLGRESMVLLWKQVLNQSLSQAFDLQGQLSDIHHLDGIYRKYLPRSARLTPSRGLDDVFIGTTLIATYGRPTVNDSDVAAADLSSLQSDTDAICIDPLPKLSPEAAAIMAQVSPDFRARSAMSYFHSLRSPESGPPPKLDIQAWTAILGVAAQAGNNTPMRSISAVFARLKHDSALPDPNVVTYTVYASALMRRGLLKQAYALYAEEILPKAAAGELQLDCAAIQMLCGISTQLGDANEALTCLQFFCVEPVNSAFVAPLVLHDHVVSETLRGNLRPDQSLINAVLTHLGAAHDFARFWQLYHEAGDLYGMPGDEVTLSILCKAVITEASIRKSGQLPTCIDDVFSAPRGSVSQKQLDEDPLSILNMLRGQRDRPHEYVRSMFWNMIHDNYPAAIQRAEQAIRSTAARILSAAWEGAAASDPDGSAFSFTHSLKVMPATRPEEIREITRSAHWCASSSNMHMFIALLAYFGHSSELPLILAFMREARLVPTRKTICLALWSMETNGAFTADLHKVKRFVGDWLGPGAVPGDVELAEFHMKQWGKPQAPAS